MQLLFHRYLYGFVTLFQMKILLQDNASFLSGIVQLLPGPCGISSRVSLSDIALEEGMILSDGEFV